MRRWWHYRSKHLFGWQWGSVCLQKQQGILGATGNYKLGVKEVSGQRKVQRVHKGARVYVVDRSSDERYGRTRWTTEDEDGINRKYDMVGSYEVVLWENVEESSLVRLGIYIFTTRKTLKSNQTRTECNTKLLSSIIFFFWNIQTILVVTWKRVIGLGNWR